MSLIEELVTLKVLIKLFAGHREKVGKSQVVLNVPIGSTVGSLLEEMMRKYFVLSLDSASFTVAVNKEYQNHLYELADGDEVAIIPPVSGGAERPSLFICGGKGD